MIAEHPHLHKQISNTWGSSWEMPALIASECVVCVGMLISKQPDEMQLYKASRKENAVR